MSKYTTEVRFICEQYAGRTEQGDYTDIDEVVELAYPKIFDVDNIPVYVEAHKPLLLKKILLHYYQREIGFETVGLWKHYLNTKLKEIMPYYNQLYASELLEYDPLQNVNNTHTHAGLYEDTSKVDNVKKYDNQTDTSNSQIAEGSKKYDNTTNTADSNIAEGSTKYDNTTNTDNSNASNRNLTNNQTTTNTVSNQYSRNEDVLLKHNKKTSRGDDTVTHEGERAKDQWTLFSDTPQGGINGVQNAGGSSQSGTLSDNAYLTNATHVTDIDGKYSDKTEYGTITEGYGDNTGHDITTIGGTEQGTEQGTSNIAEGENRADVSNGKQVDNALTKTTDSKTANGTQVDDALTRTTDSKISNGQQVDDAKTVEDNLKKDNGSDTYENKEFGKIGVMTYQEMVMKYRDTFLNIDMMIINELGDLFMKVW